MGFTCIDNSIIATAIPKITDQFHSLGDVGWYGSGRTPVMNLTEPELMKLPSISPYNRLSPVAVWEILQFLQYQMGVSHRDRRV